MRLIDNKTVLTSTLYRTSNGDNAKYGLLIMTTHGNYGYGVLPSRYNHLSYIERDTYEYNANEMRCLLDIVQGYSFRDLDYAHWSVSYHLQDDGMPYYESHLVVGSLLWDFIKAGLGFGGFTSAGREAFIMRTVSNM